MSTELPKTYDPASVEKLAYQTWLDEKSFHPNPTDKGDPYCIVIPPPNVTGALHLGHAIDNTLQDILIRQHRMAGFNTLWIPGIDHAGIATQAVVEKQLKEQENKTRYDVGREGLVERIWKWKQQFGDRILTQLQRLGCSCDWDRSRFTLDDQCAKAVRETFFKLFKDGLIYRGKRLVNWDIFLQTSISDDEIYHETVKTSLWHIKYPIDGTDQFMVVATTRPETMLGDTAVAVHSEDARWNRFIGEKVRLPLTDRLIPIIADDILVDPKFGTGVVKVTPAHDHNDYAVWQRHQGKPDQIDLINILNPDGTLNANAGKYAGMKREAARKKVVEDLTATGLLVKEEPYETQVGHSDRSKTPIEPYLSDQWFVKMAPLAEPALQVVRDGTVKFFPERHAQQYLSWLGEKRDWPISRQLWWGHRIPVWSSILNDECGGRAEDFAEGTPSQNLSSQLDLHYRYFRACGVADDVALFPEANDTQSWINICAKSDLAVRAVELLNARYARQGGGDEFNDAASEIANKIAGDIECPYRQDPDVLDTWFSSALWPHSTLGWPEQTADLAKWYPTSVLLTARDIITLWVARMVMMGMYNMGNAEGGGRKAEGGRQKADENTGTQSPPLAPGSAGGDPSASPSPGNPGEGRGGGYSTTSPHATPLPPGKNPHPNPPPEYREREKYEQAQQLGIPFFDVAIHPTILDGKGERMSKSKGNGVDPVDVIDTHGADALRFTLATMATETQDVRMPVKKDAQGRNTSDKFDLGRNFCTKLWNAFRFAISNLESHSSDSATSDLQPLTSNLSLADRWIISRFNQTVAEADAALKQYRFDVYARCCYDFFWRDFCDWYVEAIKPALRDPQRAPQTANVLAAVLDGALRLMHPVIPFITEILWWKLNEVRPVRDLPGYISSAGNSPRLIKAAWPTFGPIDQAAAHVFPRMQEIVAAIRNVRNDYKVDPKKPVTVHIAPPGDDAVQATRENRELIELLAICTVKTIDATIVPPAGAVRVMANQTCEIFIEGLVDAEAEQQRATKQIAELEKQIASLEGRLNNPGYLAKAPPHLVEQTKNELETAKAELAKLKK